MKLKTISKIVLDEIDRLNSIPDRDEYVIYSEDGEGFIRLKLKNKNNSDYEVAKNIIGKPKKRLHRKG